ncbi:hypothetical protein DOJK_01145 [Patescibacteria group bacterium]|nr:hypothetical protein DOJK_01145 [Patescibacteria group bacterium]
MKPDLKYIIDNELFIICPFLSTDQFVSYCKDRDIRTSREQLEQFEKLEIFYPFARVKYPKIKIKVKYSDNGNRCQDLGILEEDEKWAGDLREEYAHFWFEKEYAKNWLEEGLLWEPSSRPFQSWKTFYDESEDKQIESFYSVFQCYTLYHLISNMEIMGISAGWWFSYNKEDINNLTSRISDWATTKITSYQKNGIRGESAAVLCQIISNRYFPITQSDYRSIQVSIPIYYDNWNWDRYCRNWDNKAVFDDIGMSIDDLKRLQELVAIEAKYVDPLERWYELIRFVSVEKKKNLKGKALFAQTLYSMEEMLRLFYKDLTGIKLHPPDESFNWKKDNFYGEGVIQNELQYLEFLTNQYHLNPKSKLILVVEGNGEAEQFPRLAKELFGSSFPKLGIEIVNLQGIGSFTGKKVIDRYGALERFIDDYHRRQTIVFIVLDKEGRVPQIKERLVRAPSKYHPKRKVTKGEYIHVWNKNIEFDNFTDDEIALAMTKLSEGRYTFKLEEVADCRKRFLAKEGDLLIRLFKERVAHYELSKPNLLNMLFGFIISSSKNSTDDKTKRPVVKIIQDIIKLSKMNYQPVTLDIWLKNQESGYFGDPVEKKS